MCFVTYSQKILDIIRVSDVSREFQDTLSHLLFINNVNLCMILFMKFSVEIENGWFEIIRQFVNGVCVLKVDK